MKVLSIIASAIIVVLLACCANTSPNSQQVQAIENVCAVDTGLRPVITELLAVPNLATLQEIAAITAARAVIDPICANPAGSVQTNAIAAVTSASAQIVGIITQLQSRKNG